MCMSGIQVTQGMTVEGEDVGHLEHLQEVHTYIYIYIIYIYIRCIRRIQLTYVDVCP
jgi:hypothetical protein